MARPEPHPALAEARRLVVARKGPPTEADVPPPSVLPGRKPVILPGQLSLAEEPDGEEAEEA